MTWSDLRLPAVVLCLIALLAVSIGPANAATVPTVAITPPTAPVIAGVPHLITVQVTDGAAAAPSVPVTVVGSGPQGRTVTSAAVVSNVDGSAVVALAFPSAGAWSLVADAATAGSPVRSAPIGVVVVLDSSLLNVTIPLAITSERRAYVRVAITSAATGAAVPVVVLTVTSRLGVNTSAGTSTSVLAPSGVAVVPFSMWKTGQVRITVPATATSASAGLLRTVRVQAGGAVVAFPRGSPQPTVRYPAAPAPLATGANATISVIGTTVQRSMRGISWRVGCIPFALLRYISVNYWGFDGYRYRGHLVVAASRSKAVAAIFARLYAIRYPLRSMVLPDKFGKAPYGPGANDYRSMAADNTYGFNCRYIVGKERSRSWSPHAVGKAVDINTWENPYASRTGIYPQRWWFPRSRVSVAVLRSGSLVVRIFAHYGFRWGGSYGDYQHFQR